MELIQQLSQELKLRPAQVEAAVRLLDEGNTIPFIARYRKEMTDSLDDAALRDLSDRLEYLRNLQKRREEVIRSITEQEKLTPELETAIQAAATLAEVEDLYRPYKPKRRTRGSIAREKGLEPLAAAIRVQNTLREPLSMAAEYVNPEKGVETAEDALSGAMDIIAEDISDDGEIRKALRLLIHRAAVVTATGDSTENTTYKMYYDFKEPVGRIAPHRVLAINRGENEKKLKVTLKEPADRHIAMLCQLVITRPSPYDQILRAAAADSYKRLISPQMEREIRNELTAQAEKQAIDVFAENLRHLLLQPPFAGQIILGLDPGFRTGCKAAVISATGQVLDYGTYYLTHSEQQKHQSAVSLANMIRRHGVTLISIGNGTASYETEQFVSHLIEAYHLKCRYVIANEAGASVYSASDLAREELPDLDVTIRGAVSIARRIQDPLAESVKIDPRAIGVGQYQHDVNQKALSAALDQVVTSVVNYVGVDLNTASPALLQHIAGLTAATAGNIVAYRNENGPFQNRQDLLNVPRLGPATFTQCAGFLRIKDGTEPLDNTSVHPESYGLAEKIAGHYGLSHDELKDPEKLAILRDKIQMNAAPKLAASLGAGEPTIKDILEELRKPGRDVRSDFPKPLTRRHALSLSDLQIGSVVRGTVQNVVDFGAFVDFGLKTPGLVHRSQLSRHPFRHPTDVVHAGDIVEAEIISVDAARGRIGLSMKKVKK